MIDSIYTRLPKTYLTQQQLRKLINTITIYRENKIVAEPGNPKVQLIGSYKNFKITLNPNTIALNGSIPKFVNGHNISTLDFQQTKEALYQLQSEIGLPLLKADLARVDIGECFFLEKDLRYYFASLLDTPGYDRFRYEKEKGVRYDKRNMTLSFYDKNKEAAQTAPAQLMTLGDDVMRIEMRIMKNLHRYLIYRTKKFNVAYLLSEQMHRRMGQIWYSHFDAILKNRKLLEVISIDGWKGFRELPFTAGLYENGISQWFDILALHAKHNNWDARTVKSVKDRLIDSFNSDLTTKPNKYVQELESKVQAGSICQFINKFKNK